MNRLLFILIASVSILSSCAPQRPICIFGNRCLNKGGYDYVRTTLEQRPPHNKRNLAEIMAENPIQTEKVNGFEYGLWYYYEMYPNMNFWSCWVSYKAKGDHILAYNITYPNVWGKTLHAGDPSLSLNNDPGFDRIWLKAFKKRALAQAKSMNKRAVFSPSGWNARFLDRNESIDRWNGETAIVRTKPSPQEKMQPSPPVEPADTEAGWDTLTALIGGAAQVALNAKSSTISAPVVSTNQTDEQIARNRAKNEEIHQMWLRKAEKAKAEGDYWRDVHYGKGGFSTF